MISAGSLQRARLAVRKQLSNTLSHWPRGSALTVIADPLGQASTAMAQHYSRHADMTKSFAIAARLMDWIADDQESKVFTL